MLCTAIAQRFGCGIDEDLNAAGREALAQLRGVTMRSIQRLAAELYGGNAHFLLELVQNADDNKYPAGTTPQLRMEARVGSSNPRLKANLRVVVTLEPCCDCRWWRMASSSNSTTMRWGSRRRM